MAIEKSDTESFSVFVGAPGPAGWPSAWFLAAALLAIAIVVGVGVLAYRKRDSISRFARRPRVGI